MDDKKRKRVLKLTEKVLEQLDEIEKYFHIDKSSYIRMAICHGIDILNQGYCPYRNHNIRKNKRKSYPIVLPEKTWEDLNKAKDTLAENWNKREDRDTWDNRGERIPDGEMVELFIDMELKGQRELIKHVFDSDEDEEECFAPHSLKIRVDIPELLYDRFEAERKATGMTAEKLARYLFKDALMNEFYGKQSEMINSDADMIRFIDALNLDRYKAIKLLAYMMNAGKIILLQDLEKEKPI